MRKIRLPAPPDSSSEPVNAWHEPIDIDTYDVMPPDRNPMFLERRVYQGSSGRVYPLPYYDRIDTQKRPRRWSALHIENDYLRVVVLPEIGGRIHVLQDKKTGYDLIYRQDVIKPALVGLAGPWISGGIEFNWPQHHRPATYMATDWFIEAHDDGSKTIWCSDHDPMNRLKGMHGVCLHPDRAYVELKVRLYNRTSATQTFLWWANVATRVHEGYQSFFPPDVRYVADHAKRATSRYPLCEDQYYGVRYGDRPHKGIPPNETPTQFSPSMSQQKNDLSWYANIPVPTSYMCMGTKEDFFGGYDHHARAGLVHIANHHIAPGKKQWTWGNHHFGYAWDRLLTDADENGVCHPYIELMAGVYTDNQPDFSFLQPGETKTFSQYWYPIHQIGPATHASLDASISVADVDSHRLRVGVAVTRPMPGARVRILIGEKTVHEGVRDLAPQTPYVETISIPASNRAADCVLTLSDANGELVLRYAPKATIGAEAPEAATEPPAPESIASADELYLTGLHLQQYRHATRAPELYWREALRRDPADSRCNTAMGQWHLLRGEWPDAERHLRVAIGRLTRRNPNPYDGEAYYLLGETLRHQERFDEAYDAYYKGCWNQAWQSAGYHALAEIDARRQHWAIALDHVDRALKVNVDNLRARNLKAIILRHLKQDAAATRLFNQTLSIDPLDWWARHLAGQPLTCDTATRFDLAIEYVRVGLFDEAITQLKSARPEPISGTAPMLEYYLAWLFDKQGNAPLAHEHREKARAASPDYCFPSRLEDIAVLIDAVEKNPKDARAPYYLGNLLFDRRRYEEAIRFWERAATLDESLATVWRNLGIAYFNVERSPEKARHAYEKAFKADPNDGRLLYERDQLAKQLRVTPAERLKELQRHRTLVDQRDDLSIELASLYNLTGQHEPALALIVARPFQPWEGGEGQALGQYVLTHLAMGRRALASGDAAGALSHFEQAAQPPLSLGEAPHPLQNFSHIHFWTAEALRAMGRHADATHRYEQAAEFKGDFQGMQVRAMSEMTYYSAMSMAPLGDADRATQTFRQLLDFARDLANTPAKIDYFATSLPSMLLFHTDMDQQQRLTARFIEGQALLGLGEIEEARVCFDEVARLDPNHPLVSAFRASADGGLNFRPASI
jgi:tetratricopeptide (TPR) repeat protein